MHLFILFAYLLLVNVRNNILKTDYEVGVDNSVSLQFGVDERFSLEYDDYDKMYMIQKNQYNLDLLKKLQSYLPTQEKINAIEMNDFTSIYKPNNIKAGGLMNDWELDIPL